MLKNPDIGLDDKVKLLIPFVTEVTKNNPINDQMKEASMILLKQYPKSAKTNALFADILYNADEIEKSVKYYNESLKFGKNNFTVWKQLMSIYTLLENWEELSQLSENAIDYYPNQVSSYYNAGRAYIYLNKVEKGIKYLDEAVSYSSKSEKFKSEIQLIKVKGFIIQGKSEKASAILGSLKKKFTEKNPFYWELKGDLEKVKGNIVEANKYWEQSHTLGNNTKGLLKKLIK
jgi:tetratricopeptide (TPR) repeat protein